MSKSDRLIQEEDFKGTFIFPDDLDLVYQPYTKEFKEMIESRLKEEEIKKKVIE